MLDAIVYPGAYQTQYQLLIIVTYSYLNAFRQYSFPAPEDLGSKSQHSHVA